MNSDLHPLAVPFPPLQRVGLFAAASVRALADFAALNAAARECVTQMGVRDRALPGALRADIARGADRAAVKCAWECEALADALVPTAQQLGIAAQVELLIAIRDVGNLPASWSLATPLAQWYGVKISAQGSVATIDRSRGADGLVDKSVTGPQGGVSTIDRSRGADGAVDSLATGPRGGTTLADRSRNADGTTSRSVTTSPPVMP